MGRLVELVEGLFGPAAVVDGALAVVDFLSVVEVLVDVGRLVVAAAVVPPAAAELGRTLAAAFGLAAPAAGCDTNTHRGWMEGKMRRGSKKGKRNKK